MQGAGVACEAPCMVPYTPIPTVLDLLSTQAAVLRRLTRSGEVVAHWGSCAPEHRAPAEFINHKRLRRRPLRNLKPRRRGRTRGGV